MDLGEITAIGAFLILFSFWLLMKKPYKFPPGPIGFPIVGYYPFLGKYPFKTLEKLGEKYGRVFSVPLGTTNVVVLNDWVAVKEAFLHKTDIFIDRPKSIIYDEIYHNSDMTFTSGPAWRDRRRVSLHHLRNLGFGKSAMEDVAHGEIFKLIEKLKTVDGKKIDIDGYFEPFVVSVIWTFVAGRAVDHDYLAKHDFAFIIKCVIGEITTTNPLNFMPYLRHIYRAKYDIVKLASKKLNKFMSKQIDDHISTHQENNPRDFIDAYLSEIYKKQKAGNTSEAFNRESLIQISNNLFLAGIDTSNNTIMWGLLYLATWPAVQQKAQQELDEVLGRQRLPTYKDRTLLNYTQAVVLETFRYSSVVTLNLLRATNANTELFGHRIPKGTVVIANLWAVHHDPKYWKDPHEFRPERFLNELGKVEKPEYLIPFSIGGRSCPGEAVAQMSVFIFIASLLHQFTFSLVPGEKAPSLDPVYALVHSPEPYSLIVRQR